METYDSRTLDSTGAFLIGELERLDQTMHEPLVDVTWSRDIDLREDVSIADENSSFTNSSFAAAGGINPTGKSWVGKDANSISRMQLDIGKTALPLYLWAMELGYTVPELQSSIQTGRPIDTQMYDGIKLKHNMDVDEMVYIGDTTLGRYGLVNYDSVVTYGNVAAGEQGGLTWATKTPDEILADVNTLISAAWLAAGYAVCPSRLLIPPTQFGYISTQKVSSAGNVSILTYLEENSVSLRVNGKKLEVLPLKWLAGRGYGSTDRMVAYTKDKNRVRYPLVPLQRTPLEYRSLWQLTTYFGRLGCVEFVYPETIQYADGI